MLANETLATAEQVHAVIQKAATLDFSLTCWNITIAILAGLIALSTISSAAFLWITGYRRKRQVWQEIHNSTPAVLTKMLEDDEAGEKVLNIIMDSPKFQARIHELIDGQFDLKCGRIVNHEATELTTLLDEFANTEEDVK